MAEAAGHVTAASLGAVILAAGAGARLGTVAKALLAGADGRTFLARILATAREVGLRDALVVVGPPHAAPVAAHAEQLGCRVVVNPEPERGMASSVALGFSALDPARCAAAWLWPVDHPAVTAATLRTLVAALGGYAAVRPVYAGRGGHPPLVSSTLWPALAGCTGADGGARGALAAAGVRDVGVDDPGCVRDVDTRADLEAM